MLDKLAGLVAAAIAERVAREVAKALPDLVEELARALSERLPDFSDLDDVVIKVARQVVSEFTDRLPFFLK